MHFVGPDQLHGFEERLTTDIYPADFGWTPDYRKPNERIDWWYHNLGSVTGAGTAEITNQLEYDKNKKYITTCIFRLKSEASALYKSLGGFATNQINLTKLESFSVKNSFEQVNFYLDLEGHIEQKSVQKSLEELGFHTESLDILGIYEASAFRQK